ncbi:hypothetical protein WA026_012139 [Henosepilachna vigintioctopunctata]|uniref:Uncharacterized protein n=1 Tax=Henosepilachna vigintioctopunctata TaxID=420089 RepID=A0AAW1VEZ7_9CUCU
MATNILNISSIIHCVNMIVSFYSVREQLSVAVFDEKDGYDFPHFLIDYQTPIAAEVPFWPPTFYIFDRLTDSEIMWIIYKMRVPGWFRPDAKFLFVGSNISNQTLRLLVSNHILDTVFFDTDTRYLHTIYPYKNGSYIDIDTTMEPIGFCYANRITINQSRLLEPKLPTNWTKTRLNILYQKNDVFSVCFYCKNKYKGIESELFYMILKRLGISANLERFVSYVSFHTTRNDFAEDFLFGVQTAEFWPSSFDITTPYFEENVAIFVPPRQLMARWKYIFTIFSIETWIAWLIAILLISMVWSLQQYIFTKVSLSKLSLDMWVAAYKLFLGQGHSFHGRNISHGIIVLCIAILSTMMNFFFGTRLTYLLNGENYEPSINSLEEIWDNRLYIGTPTHFVSSLICAELNLDDCPFSSFKLYNTRKASIV